MKPHVLQGMLWTIACTLLFFWFLSYVVKQQENYTKRVVIVHGKVCPAPPPQGGGR